MSNYGWTPKPKFTTGLNVSQEEWDRIFRKKSCNARKQLSGTGEQADMNLLQKQSEPVPTQSSLTKEEKSRNASS